MSDLSHPTLNRRFPRFPFTSEAGRLPAVITLGLALLVYLVARDLTGPSTLTQGLGLGALAAMAAALVLAARWRWVEMLMGGPDRAYRAHRWFGYGAVASLGLHWAMEPELRLPETALGELAGGAGEFAAFTVVGLAVVSVLRLVPYRIWKFSHYAMGPVFLLGAFHAVFVPSALAGTPWQTVAYAVAGLGIAGWLGTLWVHLRPTRPYRVVAAHPVPGGVDLRLEAMGKPIRSRPGQFADIAFDAPGLAEFHPFTIAGQQDGQLRFVIRGSGGYTRRMLHGLEPGMTARLRPARGLFRPQTHALRPEQVWLAGGVGITPFLAALSAMHPDTGATVRLIHVVRSAEDTLLQDELDAHAARLPQLRLVRIEGCPGAADLATAMREVGTKTHLYLCGPEGLKSLAQRVWKKQGGGRHIHDEAFDFRAAV